MRKSTNQLTNLSDDQKASAKAADFIPSNIKSSAYWNLLQNGIDQLDLCQIDHDSESFAEQFIQQLLDKAQVQTEIKATSQSSSLLKHLYQETQNRLQLHGKSDLGFGFPLFIYQDPKHPFRPIVAPLFIWPVQLIPSPNRIDGWTIKYNEKNGLEPNYYLLKHLDHLQDKQLCDKYRQRCANGSINRSELSNLCYDLIVQLELADQRSIREILPLPDLKQTVEWAKKGAIVWSGSISVFSGQRSSLLESTVKPNADSQTGFIHLESIEEHHPFGLLNVDPYQKKALHYAKKFPLTLVDGIPGSGKTYALTNILTNALSNGQRCLVVSDHLSNLQEISQLLEDCGLSELAVTLLNRSEDGTQLQEAMAQRAKTLQQDIDFQSDAFNLFLNKCKRAHRQLEANYQALKVQNFGKDNWAATVGQYLRSGREEGKELLSSQLYTKDFVFNFEEFQSLKKAVFDSEPLYQILGTFKHPLQNLNEKIFLDQSKRQGHEAVQQKTQLFLKKSSELHHRYILKTDEYAEQLHTHYEAHFQELSSKLQELEEGIADGISQFGNEFAESGLVSTSKLHVYGVFYNKYKNILGAREHISRTYEILRRSYEDAKYFDYVFPESGESRNIRKLQQSLPELKTVLQRWRQNIPQIIQEEIQRLSNKTVHTGIDYDEQIEALEYALDLLVEELNESGLYQEVFENKMLTIPMRQQYLEGIIEQLDTTVYNMRDFDVFFDWHRHWLQLSPSAQKLIHALVKVKPKDWNAAFESWYFHNRLNLDFQIDLPQNDDLFKGFIDNYQALKKQLPQQIQALWQNQQAEQLRQMRRQNKQRYQQLFPKTVSLKTISLKELWQQSAEIVSTFFPILLVNTETASEVFAKANTSFDFVLFDDAQALSLEHSYPALQLGKQKVLFTDSNLEDISQNKSLLQHFWKNDAAEVVLQNQQRPLAAPISRFNHHVLFQKKGHLLSNEIEQKNPFQIVVLDGHFDEAKGINQKEAEQVIRQLHRIEKTAEHIYPSIAVACSTIAQRNYIAKLLLEMKQRKAMGHEKMQALENAGLGIYHLSELAGLHPEVLIFSLTLGTSTQNNQLSAELDFFQSEAGITAYYLLATRPSHQMIIIHSLTNEVLNSCLLRPKETALSTMARHFLYAQAIQANDQTQQRQLLRDLPQSRKPQSDVSVFTLELANALQPYLEEGRIVLNASIENLRLPLIVKPIHPQAPPFVIQVDGFFSDTDTGAYLWEQQLREKLRFLRLEYYPVWSVNWWKNPKQEARKLASIIIKKDAEYGHA